ncbi:Gfo/Idh/MocA family protein [Sphingomonas aerophila]|jgi:predicted dehydrogenase|uniref:Glucose-fructose oxidoreductase n=1 Tax=Sphingomonas aerophila TaxID=1344948 RepID=A0A7W9BGU1_9SPHN|nr:Gfo/Idh/MocA family oxidoreductase [Sphingomonas aerophila]MBB5716684.1 glucose-fructose oxidoreductase [Sphingomonas aerophila]
MDGIDRRGVLAGGGALAAAALAARAGAADAKPLRYAIVGLGYYAVNVILPQFANCRSSRVTGLVSGDPAKARRIAAQYGVPERSIYNYQNYDRIADNPDIDAVYVILPNSMHAEYTIRAAKAGKHVLCEKPMSNTAAEAEAMIAACKRAGKKLMIGYRIHFEPNNLNAIRLIREGAIGKLRFIDAEHGFVQGDPSKWRLKKALSGGGSLADMGIYSLQAARYLSGEEPNAVLARTSTDRTDPRFHEVEDLIQWTLAFPSGAVASCMSSYSSAHNHVRATGSSGWLDLDPATSYEGITLRRKTGDRTETVPAPAGPGKTMFAAQLDHLADCVASGREPIVSGEEGLRDMRIIEAIYRSAQTGRTVDL